MKTLKTWSSLLFVAAVALSTACSGPTYRTEHYTLLASADAAQMQGGATYDPTLGVGPVRLPELLDHSGIVSHGEGQRLHVAPYQVWAGDLREAITRVLADDLSALLASDQVWAFPWSNGVRPERQLTVVFERFSGERGGPVHLQAKWRLLSSNGNEQISAGKSSLTTEAQGDSYGAYVAALNKLLNEFAGEMAQHLRGIDGR